LHGDLDEEEVRPAETESDWPSEERERKKKSRDENKDEKKGNRENKRNKATDQENTISDDQHTRVLRVGIFQLTRKGRKRKRSGRY
jgi:hypothetical protein